MGDVIPFGRKPKPKISTLCVNNHHKWSIDKTQKFDVKKGKLVTVERCTKCGKIRTSMR